MTAPYASGGKGRVTPEAEIATKVKSPSVTSIRSPVRWRRTQASICMVMEVRPVRVIWQ